MKTNNFKLKTTLNCGGCVSKVQGDLDRLIGAGEWNVDTDSSDKVLTVHADGITEEEVIAVVKSKGFDAEPLSI